ncbi:MAG: DegV family EDD domain-containing protein [Ruminococcaceae bacterium]|nr:DegV family EDD domain-containing protein [Oscillospiraceae bacterium]
MKYRIVSDSSSDLLTFENCDYCCVPLKIITDEKEYIDDHKLNIDEMIDDLSKYNGTSHSSCPNMEEWLDSFENTDGVFCVTITSGLSGSYNSASMAVSEYLQKNPENNAVVLDTLSTGPESALIIEKIRELIQENLPFSVIESKVREYMKSTHLIFCLESLKNLANNGRVNKAVAKVAGIIGIRILGKASNEGTLEITNKVRGSEKVLSEIIKNMKSSGFIGGKVRIHHCQNESAAYTLRDRIKDAFPNASVFIQKTGALCSFYAESGGLLVGFEGGVK